MSLLSIRCTFCNKKAGLTALECKCGNKYCSKHRYAEDHSWIYDYKENGRKQLEIKLKLNEPSTKGLNQNQNNYGGGGNCA